LSSATFQYALQQIDSADADIHTVEALLLLLTWQFPSTPQHEEAGYILSGALIHLAFKFGLHIAESGQDFVRVKLNLSECEVMRRRNLWAGCLITYQESASRFECFEHMLTSLQKQYDAGKCGSSDSTLPSR
jgi:hypothetical protein